MISIIVPVYNMESYLQQCLDSILSQTLKDWECILVDDGSTDRSGKICDDYAKQDSRFKVVHTENGGLSAARNKGLEIARSEFIGFVDSDDYIHPEMYENLYELITKYDADVVQTGCSYIFKTYNRPKRFVKDIEILDQKETALQLIESKKIANYVWTKLFRRHVISSPFPTGLVFEDMYVMSDWTKNIHKFIISPTVHYCYRKRKSSISHTVSPQHQNNYIRSRFRLIDNLSDLMPVPLSDDKINYYKWKALISACKQSARGIKDTETALAMVTEIRDNCPTLPLPTKEQLGRKLYQRAKWLMKKPKLFITMMKLTQKLDLHSRFENINLYD